MTNAAGETFWFWSLFRKRNSNSQQTGSFLMDHLPHFCTRGWTRQHFHPWSTSCSLCFVYLIIEGRKQSRGKEWTRYKSPNWVSFSCFMLDGVCTMIKERKNESNNRNQTTVCVSPDCEAEICCFNYLPNLNNLTVSVFLVRVTQSHSHGSYTHEMSYRTWHCPCYHPGCFSASHTPVTLLAYDTDTHLLQPQIIKSLCTTDNWDNKSMYLLFFGHIIAHISSAVKV